MNKELPLLPLNGRIYRVDVWKEQLISNTDPREILHFFFDDLSEQQVFIQLRWSADTSCQCTALMGRLFSLSNV